MAQTDAAKNVYEMVDRTSPSKATFQTDGGSATMDFIVDRSQLKNLVSGLLGKVEKSNDGSGSLKRTLPAAHPYYDWMFASKINSIEGLQPNGRYDALNGMRDKSLNYITDCAMYLKYKITVEFEHRPYLMMTDEEIKGYRTPNAKWYYDLNDNFRPFDDCWEYSRFVDVESQPNVEFLSSPTGQFKFKTASGTPPHNNPISNQNGGGVQIRIIKQKVRMTWFFVPYTIAFAENVTAGFGKINQYDFWNYPKGSLLLEGFEIKRYPPPEQLFGNDPVNRHPAELKLCDITFIFGCFIPPADDVSSDIPSGAGYDKFKVPYGHNLLPRPGTIKYYYVESEPLTSEPSVLSRPVYESYPMQRLFLVF